MDGVGLAWVESNNFIVTDLYQSPISNLGHTPRWNEQRGAGRGCGGWKTWGLLRPTFTGEREGGRPRSFPSKLPAGGTEPTTSYGIKQTLC